MHNETQTIATVERSATDRARGLFIAAAFISFLLSIWLWFTGSREEGLFVGLWVPSILSLGSLMLSRGSER